MREDLLPWDKSHGYRCTARSGLKGARFSREFSIEKDVGYTIVYYGGDRRATFASKLAHLTFQTPSNLVLHGTSIGREIRRRVGHRAIHCQF